jgi:hypothetical protein
MTLRTPAAHLRRPGGWSAGSGAAGPAWASLARAQRTTKYRLPGSRRARTHWTRTGLTGRRRRSGTALLNSGKQFRVWRNYGARSRLSGNGRSGRGACRTLATDLLTLRTRTSLQRRTIDRRTRSTGSRRRAWSTGHSGSARTVSRFRGKRLSRSGYYLAGFRAEDRDIPAGNSGSLTWSGLLLRPWCSWSGRPLRFGGNQRCAMRRGSRSRVRRLRLSRLRMDRRRRATGLPNCGRTQRAGSQRRPQRRWARHHGRRFFRLRRRRGGLFNGRFFEFGRYDRRTTILDRQLRFVVFGWFIGLVGNGNGPVIISLGLRGIIRVRNSELLLDRDRDVLVDRARVSLLFLDAKFGQQFEDPVWFNL